MVQAALFDILLNEPDPQGAQVRLDIALPTALTNWLAGQLRHSAQEAALALVLNEPGSHALHARLTVGEPAVLTNWPAPQLAQFTHGVAGFVS